MIDYERILDAIIGNAKADTKGHIMVYHPYWLDEKHGTCHDLDSYYYNEGMDYKSWRRAIIKKMKDEERRKQFGEKQKEQ